MTGGRRQGQWVRKDRDGSWRLHHFNDDEYHDIEVPRPSLSYGRGAVSEVREERVRFQYRGRGERVRFQNTPALVGAVLLEAGGTRSGRTRPRVPLRSAATLVAA